MATPMVSWRRQFFTLKVMSMVAAGLLLAGCTVEPLHNGPIDDQRAAKLELICTLIKLPIGAHNVWLHQDNNRILTQDLRFEAPTAAARAFAAALLEGDDSQIWRPLTRGYDPYLGGPPGVDWWLKSFPPNAEGGRTSYPSRRIVVLAKGDAAIVWLSLYQDLSNRPLSSCPKGDAPDWAK